LNGNNQRKLAQRVQEIPPFHVMEVVRVAQILAARGVDIIHLEVGEPDFSSPELVVSAAKDALDRGQTRYTDARGTAPLRQAIADWYAKTGIYVPPERIQLTQGASGALLLALAVTTNPGDQVLLADPSYPCNPRFIEAVGGRVHWLETEFDTGFQPTLAHLAREAGPCDTNLMLAHPANPTGMAVPPDALRSIVDWCNSSGRHLVVDEIYHSLMFKLGQNSSLAYGDQHFVVGSFSKYFNMTGWRLGWLVVPEFALAATQKLAQHLFICPSSIAQSAAVACFDSSVLEEAETRRSELKVRRDMLVPGLQRLGFKVACVPDGAFYVFADAVALTDDAQAFCIDLIKKTGVALTPGIDFSSRLPASWLRIAYTQPVTRLEEALLRIERYLNDRV